MLRSVAAFRVGPASVSDRVHAIQATAATVTADYFAGPRRHALFAGVCSSRPTSCRMPGRPLSMSRSLWQTLFNADPAALGRDLLVNGTNRQLVGIVDLPASIPGASDVWLPYPSDGPLFRNRRTHLFTVIGRRLSGVSEAQLPRIWQTSAPISNALAPDAGALTIRATPLRERIVRPIRRHCSSCWPRLSCCC